MGTSLVYFVLIFSSLITISSGQTGSTGRYPKKYNLIDADPSCRHNIPSKVCCIGSHSEPQCPLIYNGAGNVDVMANHPNVQERTDYLMRNMARLYPDFYASSEWGFGGGAYAGDCDKPDTRPTKPFYFMSEAVQAARWNSFSGATKYSGCSRGNFTTGCANAAQTSHYTCCNYCIHNIWKQCGFKYRTKAMVQLLFTKNAWNDVGSEGVWGRNNVYPAKGGSSAHCGMVFNSAYNHQGIGYYPSGSTTMVGIKDTDDWEDHVFPHATHFGWKQEDFTFLVQFFGGKQNPPVVIDTVYLLYKGQMISMEFVIGNSGSGFYKTNQLKTTECEPYAFVAKDQNGVLWRLPEDERYYFGTVDHPNKLRDGSATCMENHYFYTGNKWVANGAESLMNNKTSNTCIGCDKILALEDVHANQVKAIPPSTGGQNIMNMYIAYFAFIFFWLINI